MSLKSEIALWDGKSAADIRAIYADHAHTRGLLGRLVKLAADPECEVGATWLVKHHLETTECGMALSAAKTWYACANTLTHWEARLHMLQCTPRVPVPNACVKPIRGFLDTCLTDKTSSSAPGPTRATANLQSLTRDSESSWTNFSTTAKSSTPRPLSAPVSASCALAAADRAKNNPRPSSTDRRGRLTLKLLDHTLAAPCAARGLIVSLASLFSVLSALPSSSRVSCRSLTTSVRPSDSANARAEP